MRSRSPALGAAALAAAAVALAAPAVRADDDADDPIEERLAVVDQAESLIVDKKQLRAEELRARVRALYKLTRAGTAPLWVDGDARAELLRRRGAARRILVRDLRELEILREELAAVVAARERLAAAQAEAEAAPRPEPRSLTRPVRGALVSRFGRYRGRRTKTELLTQGIKLAARDGEPVRAPHAGTVVYTGPLRGLDDVVVIARDDGVRSVLGHLGDVSVTVGDDVEAGAEIGIAGRRRVYLEVRIAVGAGGLPIDPEPLLGR